MVEINLESAKEDGCENLTSKGKRVGIRREPSFSGWYDEDGIPCSVGLINKEVDLEDFDFKLPLTQPHSSENEILDGERLYYSTFSQKMEPGGVSDAASTNGLRDQTKGYVPFDIESDPDAERYSTSTNDLDHVDYLHTSRKKLENPISVADVLKTLFFILVWYTFSTFLTL